MKSNPAQLDATGKQLLVMSCVVCGYKFDAATAPFSSEARPRPGDLSLCMKCGEIYRFNEKLELQIPTLAQLTALDSETMFDLTRIQEGIRRHRVLG